MRRWTHRPFFLILNYVLWLLNLGFVTFYLIDGAAAPFLNFFGLLGTSTVIIIYITEVWAETPTLRKWKSSYKDQTQPDPPMPV